MVDILSRVSPGIMREVHEEDIDLSKTICYKPSGKKTTYAQI